MFDVLIVFTRSSIIAPNSSSRNTLQGKKCLEAIYIFIELLFVEGPWINYSILKDAIILNTLSCIHHMEN